MNPRWKIVVRDLAVGVVGLALFGWFLWTENGGLDGVGTTEVLLVSASALAYAAVQYRSERETLPAAVYEFRDALRESVALMLLTVVVVAVVALAPLVAFALVEVYLAAFFGLYVGSIGYRAYYGLLRPVPEPALSRA